ncbi:alpha-glucosidase precursor [Ophiobolus disseminans]|uniref:alpha-glucosidase n=1 Tax=Ophiobolus disseminans TaxID=1469910 RepID=A0A6A7ACQ4_9PLEO|nr:alpha-glucosidase precursor [Ophiobolus disseminans]
MFNKLLLWLALCAGTALAAPHPHNGVPQEAASILQARDANPNACPGYAASNVVKTDSSLTADLTLAGDACNVYSDDIKDLKLVVEYQTNDRLHVKIYDAGLQAFQVQEEVLPRPENEQAASSGAALQFDIVEKPFSFTVKRKENGEILFDTSSVPLVFEKQYVRLRTKLPNDPNIYGLGEHSDNFRLGTKYQRGLMNAEAPNIPQKQNLYGSHPVYFDHRGAKGTHAVFLLNSTPMNIDLAQDQGSQYLEYNTIGGIIDLYFMAGKSPVEVSKQYADVVGHSAMYPYWTLGFHQCRFGYWDVNMVAEVVGNYSTAGIPLEVMWTDIDYMHLREDFTTDPDRFPIPKMRELVTTLHQRDQRYVLILDPGIHAVGNYAPYQRGIDSDVFLKGADRSNILGVQWPGEVAWPDWLSPKTNKWWTSEIGAFFDKDTGIDLDGLWVDMNEASNFCDDEKCEPRAKAKRDGTPPLPGNAPRPNTGRPIPGFPASFQPGSSSPKVRDVEVRDVEFRDVKVRGVEVRNVESVETRDIEEDSGTSKGFQDRDWFNPKYQISNLVGKLTQKTIYTNTSNHDGSRQYDTHNLHGHTMAHATYDAMLSRRSGLRPFVLTRSTWAGTGRKATHWFGDNFSSWEHYRTSIRQMLAFVSMHQMPLVGSDVCGFNGDADQYMCARWAMLGAFQPFYRNHAELSTRRQEFYQWPIVAEAAKKAIATRYKLLDYIYTALHRQSEDGTPMINPLFFLYPEDSNTFGIQDQWFYGDTLLISPVTQDYSDTVTYYLPKDRFYDYWTGAAIDGQGANVTQSNVSYTDIPIHVRGGSIIPHRKNSANTTKLLRKEDLTLMVAPAADGTAKGSLYLDDGESIEQPSASLIEFTYKDGKLSTTGSFAYAGASGESVTVSQVEVLGSFGASNAGKKSVTVDGPWKLTGAWGIDISI